MHLHIDVDHQDAHIVLSPAGEIDVATSGDLKEAIGSAIEAGGTHVVVSMLGVEFIDSTGLGALIGGRRRALTANGSLTLVCSDEHMLKLFRVTGLDKVFTIFDTVELATADPAVAG